MEGGMAVCRKVRGSCHLVCQLSVPPSQADKREDMPESRPPEVRADLYGWSRSKHIDLGSWMDCKCGWMTFVGIEDGSRRVLTIFAP